MEELQHSHLSTPKHDHAIPPSNTVHIHVPTNPSVFHSKPSPTVVREHVMPPETLADAVASVEAVSTPGGPSLAGFEIPQLPDLPSPTSSPPTVTTENLKWTLLEHALAFRAMEFQEFLSTIPLTLRVELLDEILLKLVNSQNKEAFQFVLQYIPNPAEVIENILINTNIGEVYYDETQSISQDERFRLRTEREGEYQFVMNCIREVYPIVNHYIEYITPRTDQIMRGFLFPEAIQLIVNELRDKGEFRNIDCIVCDSVQDAAAQIQAFMALGNQTDKGRCFILRTRDGILPISSHVQPIYVERRNNTSPFEYDSIILDSIGARNGEEGIPPIVFPLSFKIPDYFRVMEIKKKNRAMGTINPPEVEINTPKITFFHYNITRQMDGTNCPIFSIRDAVEIARNPDAVMEIARRTARPLKRFDTDDDNNFVFDLLPPRFMLPTQSRTVLIAYPNQYKQLIEGPLSPVDPEIFVNPTTAQRIIRKTVTKHVVKRVILSPETREGRRVYARKDTTQNIYIERKYRKYERRIIAHVIKEVVAHSRGLSLLDFPKSDSL